MKPTVCTYSGIEFDPFNPNIDDIKIVDIAHQLSNTCRFAGATLQFYSVAQHCVLMSEQFLNPSTALIALLHYAAEAYLVDMPAPLKARFPQYVEAEDLLQDIIMQKFGLPVQSKWPDRIHRADKMICAWEKRDLMPNAPWWDCGDVPPSSMPIQPWAPMKAEVMFLRTYQELRARFDIYDYQRSALNLFDSFMDGEEISKRTRAVIYGASRAVRRHSFTGEILDDVEVRS